MANIIFFDIDDVIFKTALFIESGLKKYEPYEDAKEVIEKLGNEFEIGILSKGEYDFQINKLTKTKLLKLFKKENIFIVEEKNKIIKDICKKFKQKVIYVLDDRIDSLDKIKKSCSNIKTVLIKRGRHQDIKSNYCPDFTINNLYGLLEIL